MNTILSRKSSAQIWLGATLFATATLLAQQPPESQPAPPEKQGQQEAPAKSNSGWRRVTDTPAEAPANPPSQVGQTVSSATWSRGPLDAFGQSRSGDMRPEQPQAPPVDVPAAPAELNIKAGTFLTVRVDQQLSSDRNQPGDVFSATLVKPLVVDGYVVATRGQTIAGRVVEARKAGRVEGVSRLAVEITELTAVDGQQIPIHSQMINITGDTSKGRDAGGVIGTTAMGAAIGGIADGGFGAGVGAAAGAAAGIVGVLLTRGHPSVIYPESVITLRITAPVTVSTSRAPYAFRQVDPREYERAESATRPVAPRLAVAPPPPPMWYPYSYWGPGYFTPGFTFLVGPRYWGSGWGYHRGRWR